MKIFGRKIRLEIRRARDDDYAQTYMDLRKAAVLAGDGGASATVEACVAAWERGFALLRCDNSPPYVDGAFFAACGRDLAEHGETTWLIEAGGLRRCVKADKSVAVAGMWCSRRPVCTMRRSIGGSWGTKSSTCYKLRPGAAMGRAVACIHGGGYGKAGFATGRRRIRRS